MSPAEVDALLERVRRNAEAAGAPFATDLLSSLREVAKDDDGREFVMVNLIRYRTKAVYPPGWDYGDDPHAADARYNRAVIPLLLKRACIPIFLGRSAGRFLDPEGDIFPVGVRFSLTLVRLIVAGILAVVVLLVFLWRS
jgi:hypothetical protein